MGTETKSGRVIKPPGKFSTCVSGQRKQYTYRKSQVSDVGNMTFDSCPLPDDTQPDITSSSMVVNASALADDDDTMPETTFSLIEEESM